MRRLLLAGCLLGVTATSISQKQDVPIIEQDSITKLIKDQIPFDRRFILKIKSDEKPIFINYMANKGNKPWYESINYYLEKKLFKNGSFVFDSIPSIHSQVKKENGTSFLYIEFKELPRGLTTTNGHKNNFLSPSKRYTVIIPKLYTKSLEAFDFYFQGNISSGDAVVNEILKEQKEKFNLEYFVPRPPEALKFFRDNLLIDYYQRERAMNSFQSSLSRTRLLHDFEKREFLSRSISLLSSTSPLFVLPSKYVDTANVIKGLRNLYEIPNFYTCKNILEGKCSIKDTTTSDNEIKIESSLENLKVSSDLLQSMESYLSMVQFHLSNASFDQGVTDIRELIVQINSQIEMLDNYQKIIKGIEQKILKSKKFLEPAIIEGSSYIFDFKTRSKFQVTPDFGYVVYGFQKGFTSFTPYLGFNINFRAIDKNIPWKLYPNKTFWHYLSFMTGWTLAGVEKKGQRENFFSKSSLLTGIGFKFSNAIKLNAGTLWFYENDPNPLMDKRKIKSTFYLGASFDLDIRELLNDFTSLIPNLK